MSHYLSHEFDANSTFASDSLDFLELKNVGPFPLVHKFQFTDSNDIIVRLSRAIFEDFRNKSLILKEEDFQTVIEGFLEFCDFGIKSLEQSFNNTKVDKNSKQIFTQLFLERSAYDLILKLLNAEEAVKETENFDSFLFKLFCENLEFRRILILLKWSEEMAYRNPDGFAGMINEVKRFETINNIYSTTLMRGNFTHIDSRFDSNVAREDQNNCLLLNQVLFSLLRCGRLDQARSLVKDTGLSVIGSFIFLRNFLSDPQSTPIDNLHDNYDLTKSRAFCKLTARNLIPIDDTVAAADQCIWATLSNSLSTLLSHATSTDDRLWAYATCAADSILDDYLLNIHSKGNDNVLLVKNELYDEDIPKTVNEIFAQIRINENNLYFCLYGYLIVSDWNGAIDYIKQYFDSKNDNEIQAHELRFLTHLVLLLKIKNLISNFELCDFLLSKFSDLLIDLKMYYFVPGYLIHLTEEESKKKMLIFLQNLQNPNEQQEVLSFAQEAGFNISDLCHNIYYSFKEKNKIKADDDESGRAATKMLRAWSWLSYNKETIFTAILEANYLLRKLLLHNRIAEALELLRVTPENLAAQVEEIFMSVEAGGETHRPDRLIDAQQEYECYILYFEAMKRYNLWQKHIDGSPVPELPTKLSDEQWARLDLKRRAEHELSMQMAKECLQKYIKLSDSLKERTLVLLESILCKNGGWLTPRNDDENSIEEEIRERAFDFAKIRDNYFYHIVRCLIELHTKSGDSLKVLSIANLIVDPTYNIYKSFSKTHLRKLLGEISKSGAALLID